MGLVQILFVFLSHKSVELSRTVSVSDRLHKNAFCKTICVQGKSDCICLNGDMVRDCYAHNKGQTQNADKGVILGEFIHGKVRRCEVVSLLGVKD